jgi:hypothetical protein
LCYKEAVWESYSALASKASKSGGDERAAPATSFGDSGSAKISLAMDHVVRTNKPKGGRCGRGDNRTNDSARQAS